jgi:hypothetical protein
MKLLYKGMLAAGVAKSVRSLAERYGHAVEFKTVPPEWTQWVEANLRDYNDYGEDCMGQRYTRKTKMYGLQWKDFDNKDGVFLFFMSAQEKKLACDAFRSFVVNEEPFSVLMD